MNILLIDTSGRSCCVGLAVEDRLVCEEYLDTGLTHSQTLMKLISSVYERSGTERKDTGLIGVTSGPGSFTGLRIGMSTAKALAQSFGVPIAEISTLDAIRENTGYFDGPVVTMIDALHERVYASGYDGISLEKGIYGLSEVLDEAEKTGRRVLFAGDGALKYRDIILGRGDSFSVADASDMYPRASGMLNCAMRILDSGETKDCYEAKLDYFMASQAERNLHE